MIFNFGDFQFNSKTNILTKYGQVIHLNEKPACMLSLFLQEPDKIHSKSDILDYVWPNRILTEQVIFQNISYLRAKFGDSAIKTFSRKGYQWQLQPTVADENENKLNEVSSSISVTHKKDNGAVAQTRNFTDIATITTNNNKRSGYYILSLSVLVLTLILWFAEGTFSSPKNQKQDIKSNTTVVKLVDGDKDSSLSHARSLSISAQHLFDSPYVTWNKYATTNSHWLIATRLYELEDNLALRFHIQGASRGWQGYLLATNLTEATDKLNQLSTALSSTNYFTVKSTYAALAELTVIAEKIPDKSLVNHQMIKLNYQLNNLDRANVLADQILAEYTFVEHTEKLNKGLIHLSTAQVNLRSQNNNAAEEHIEKALPIFQELNLPHLEAQALIKLSWVGLFRQEFRKSVNLLNQAASKARVAKEPLLEFEAHITQSFMAFKSGQVELSHAKLGLAKELSKLHKLDDAHQVLIHNNASWLAEIPEEKVKHNQSILALPFSVQYEGYFYTAAEIVRNHHIKMKNWSKAKDTLKPWQRNSFQSLTLAQIAFAKNETNEGIKETQKAFQYARVYHHKEDSLDAALLLLQNPKHEGALLEVADYSNFIKQHATNRWLSQNSTAMNSIKKG